MIFLRPKFAILYGVIKVWNFQPSYWFLLYSVDPDLDSLVKDTDRRNIDCDNIALPLATWTKLLVPVDLARATVARFKSYRSIYFTKQWYQIIQRKWSRSRHNFVWPSQHAHKTRCNLGFVSYLKKWSETESLWNISFTQDPKMGNSLLLYMQ